MGYIRAFFLWASIFLFTILMTTAVFICLPFALLFDKKKHSLHACGIIWAWLINFANPWWKFQISGRENLAPKGQAVVYVANHQSQIDILALFILNMRFRWLAKASLFKIPFLGWSMAAVGYVPVVRGNHKSQERAMLQATKHIQNGTPMAFFPEGTRSLTGEVGKFKTGAFRLAQSTDVPIVPISIQGCGKLLPKHSFIPQKAHVTITVHPPIPSNKYELKDLVEKVRTTILSGL